MIVVAPSVSVGSTKFRGRHDHRAHSKYRVGFPAPWRSALADASPGDRGELYAFIHPGGAITVLPTSYKEALLDAVDFWAHDRASELLLIFGEEMSFCGADVRPDPQGRIVFPRQLCDYAGVAREPRDEMIWVGKGAYAELWRGERWDDRMKTGRYSAPHGCEWSRDDVRELAAAYETTIRTITGVIR